MRFRALQLSIGMGAAAAVMGCAAADRKSADATESHAGWYMEHAGHGLFQLCGQSQQWRVRAPAELAAKAKAFGLDQDTPVYVRLVGSMQGGEIEVVRVEQFGSAVPVRDCGLTGVVIPVPAGR